jgi:malate dehydrogenase (oxaloacetate-decarboxylating)(NADP+)
VLCFPYIFRGALDAGATCINDEMQMACVRALAELAHREVEQKEAFSYQDEALQFGPDYIIPRPFDPRLLPKLAPAVAQAAMDSGVATRPIADMAAYRQSLEAFVYRTGMLMKPVFDAARRSPRRVVYAEGEEPVVLRAIQSVVDNGLAFPIVVGRPAVVEHRIEKYGLRIRPGTDFELVNPEYDERFREYWTTYHELMERRGVSPDIAKTVVRTRTAVIAALMVYRGEADAMLTGVVGQYRSKLQHVLDVIGLAPGARVPGSMSALTSEENTLFVCDTHVNPDPDARDVTEITLMAAEKLKIFGMKPKVALLSHSAFGSENDRAARKMKEALALLREQAPELEVEGEMTADMALDEELRRQVFPHSRLRGRANLLVAPDIASAHISFNLARLLSSSVTVGPILLGVAKSAHVLTSSATVRRVVNMTAIAVVDAQQHERTGPAIRERV